MVKKNKKKKKKECEIFRVLLFVSTQTYMEIFKLALPLSESTLSNCLSVNELFAMGLEATNTKFVK